MSQPYVGEIRMFAGNFAPAGWMFCEGQLLAIADNPTLFNLIGTTYGGDGQNNFALPDLRGRVPIHMGTGQSNYTLAEATGAETVTLLVTQLPAHSHALLASTAAATAATPQGNVPGASNAVSLYKASNPVSALAPQALLPDGGSQPHNNFQPYLCINFILSLFGVYPSQT